MRRSILLTLAQVCATLADRLAAWAVAAETPSGDRLRITIRREWEARAPIEMARDDDGIVIWAGGRFLRIKR